MLAAIALTLCAVVLFRMKRERYALVAIVADGVALCLHADGGRRENLPRRSCESAFSPHARIFGDAAGRGELLAPAKSAVEMQRIIFNDYVDATLCAIFIALVLSMLVYGLIAIRSRAAER